MQNNSYKLIYIPQLGVNDISIKIIKWYVSDELYVKAGDLICGVESTKTAYEVESEFEGYILRFYEEGDEVNFSNPAAVIFKDKDTFIKMHKSFFEKHKKSSNQETTITQKAVKKASELNIDIRKITKKGIIKEKDVLEFYSKQNIKETDLSLIKIIEDKINVAIYGSGKGAYTIYETLSLDKNYYVSCFIDDFPSNQGFINNIPIVWSENYFKKINNIKKISIACEIADSAFRMKLRDKLINIGIELINVIHPNTYIAPSVKLGRGNFIKAGAIIESNSEIGDCCIIDNGVIISHDNKIGDGCHLAPGVVLGSSIDVGKKSVIGIGASVSTKIKIGQNVIVGVGSSVVSNVSDNSIVEGVPGKIIGERK